VRLDVDQPRAGLPLRDDELGHRVRAGRRDVPGRRRRIVERRIERRLLERGSSSGGSSSGSSGGGSSSGGTGHAPAGLIFSPYKDTSISFNWDTNVISTAVSGASTPFASDLVSAGGKTITLAFATGECGSENWGGGSGSDIASANVSLLSGAGVNYILSTGGAAGSFTCGTDAGFSTFIERWASPNLIGVDFDIEAGQTTSVHQ